MNSTPLIALTGSPNSGKTALFNALTGRHQKVANYPGVTVEKKEGMSRTRSGRAIRVLDLPGTHSLVPKSLDERVAFNVLLHPQQGDSPDILVSVADAANLERSLSFVLELRALGKPVVLALNMIDLARKRGLDLDLEALEKALGLPVVPTVAVKKRGVEELLRVVERLISEMPLVTPAAKEWRPATGSEVRARFDEVDRVLKLSTRKRVNHSVATERIDRAVLHPVFGYVILFAVMAVLFQAVFTWAHPAMDAIQGGVGWLGTTVSQWLPEGALRSLVVDGIIAGVGSVLVFLPQIMLLFLFILLLEDSGYMARAAFLMDRLMGSVGLNGHAFIPLLSSYACAIPGIMATRTIPNPRDRLATILIVPLMTCSARLPVYTLLIAAFIPDTRVFGPFRLQGLVMFGMYVASIPFALLIAYAFRRATAKGTKNSFLLELPTYKAPSLRNVFFGLRERAAVFLKRAGKLILITSIALWFLVSYPKPPAGATDPAIHHSFAGKIGHAIEPLLRPIGFDWRIATGLIPGFAAREVMVAALGTVFAVETADGGDEDGAAKALGEKLSLVWGLPTALALLVWYIFSPQCLSTFAVARRETNSWGWTTFMFLYMLGLAYVGAFVTYRAALHFT